MTLISLIFTISDFETYRLQLLPSCFIGKSYHKMVITGINSRWNWDINLGFKCL